ncbi:phage minor capsid protein [Micromonospora andamanensis]|uniref:Intein C-terminal splicing domain-containing protein n=1 Tax=Micromonospora andamanensis TaxID=1287068 RepID=A0ABQ4HYM4_9ACTN|nr:phage minor capsid protein [Micromonospora andamanensis]GIJ10739.1 hypothetical protein Van01_39530 [Micromonospora andamanensis]
MALTGDQIEAISRNAVDLYRAAESAILDEVTRRLAAGQDAPDWAVTRIGALAQLRTAVERILALVADENAERLRELLARAYRTGQGIATRDLPAQLLPRDLDAAGAARAAGTVPRIAVVENLAAALAADVGAKHSNVLRHVLDVYRLVISQATGVSVAGGMTRRQASQWAYARFVDQGVVSFTDVSGRRWRLSSYVEMAVRTVTQRAAVQGQTDRLTTLGVDTVIVSDSPRECPRCRPWEGKILSVSGGVRGRVQLPSMVGDGTVTVDIAGTVDEARAAGLQHPNCFPGDVLVLAPSGVVAADARRYEGPIVVVHTASGNELPVTPNHPVLTPEGWVAAGQLHVGQSVLRYRGDVERAAECGPDDEQVPARIGDVFDALRQASPVAPIRVPVAPEQFHGDGFGSDVDVVLTDGLLGDGAWQKCRHGEFVRRGVGTGALLASGAPFEVVGGSGHAADGIVGGSGELAAFLAGHPAGASLGGLAAADGGTPDADPATDAGLADAEAGREVVLALAGMVEADQVVDLVRREYAGHVYNLQTGDGWYVASGIVVHNCTHSLRAYLPGATRRPARLTPNAKGYEAKERQREIERGIRKWKEREAAALTDEARAGAAAKVRRWQAAMRDHLAANPELKRLPYREQPGAGNLPRR